MRVESVVAVPDPGTESEWSFPADRDRFGIKIRLGGSGTVEVHVVLASEPSGDVVEERERRIEVDGSAEMEIDDLELPAEGGYRLTLEVTGPGIRQASTISVRRG